MRAVLRLVRGQIGNKTYRAENRRFRDAARKLSDARDAGVLIGTLDSLLEHYPDDAPSLDRLRADLDRRRREAAGHTGRTRSRRMSARPPTRSQPGPRDRAWKLKTSDWQPVRGRASTAPIATADWPKGVERGRVPASIDARVPQTGQGPLVRAPAAAGAGRPACQAWSTKPICSSDLLGDYNDLSVLRTEIAVRRRAGRGSFRPDRSRRGATGSILGTGAADRPAALRGEAVSLHQPDRRLLVGRRVHRTRLRART